MSRRGRHAFLDHWHRKELDLPDGDVLRWILIADGVRPLHAECFRSDQRGALHPDAARRILRAAGHPDADHVPDVGRTIGVGRFH